jgi:hypothetical protein
LESAENRIRTRRRSAIATTELELPPGEWQISTVSDDGIRVYVDDQLVIDNWTWHGPTRDVARSLIHGGKHSVKVEHFEIDGWAQRQFIVRRMKKKALSECITQPAANNDPRIWPCEQNRLSRKSAARPD